MPERATVSSRSEKSAEVVVGDADINRCRRRTERERVKFPLLMREAMRPEAFVLSYHF